LGDPSKMVSGEKAALCTIERKTAALAMRIGGEKLETGEQAVAGGGSG